MYPPLRSGTSMIESFPIFPCSVPPDIRIGIRRVGFPILTERSTAGAVARIAGAEATVVPAAAEAIVGFAFGGIGEDIVSRYYEAVALFSHLAGDRIRSAAGLRGVPVGMI